MPPQFIGDNAEIKQSIIAEGSHIEGSVDYSVLFSGVVVEPGATVNYSVIMPGTVIKAGAKVEYAIVGSDSVIGENALIGSSPETSRENDVEWGGIAVVGNNVTVSPGSVVEPKQIIGENI